VGSPPPPGAAWQRRVGGAGGRGPPSRSPARRPAAEVHVGAAPAAGRPGSPARPSRASGSPQAAPQPGRRPAARDPDAHPPRRDRPSLQRLTRFLIDAGATIVAKRATQIAGRPLDQNLERLYDVTPPRTDRDAKSYLRPVTLIKLFTRFASGSTVRCVFFTGVAARQPLTSPYKPRHRAHVPRRTSERLQNPVG
jgi:hypothetical protein